MKTFFYVLVLSCCCSSSSAFAARSWSPSSPFTVATTTTAAADREALLDAVSQVQSRQNQQKVECLIALLADRANLDKKRLKQPIKLGTAYRTVWSTVTASTPIGQILRQKPAAVLGGDSWQVISKDGKKAENIVYWPLLGDKGIRMIGLADLRPLPQGANGYTLIIKGLMFRLGRRDNIPEVDGTDASDDTSFTLIKLEDGKELENGKGTLEVLYFDGVVRISRDNVQKNTYIHILEPISNKQMRDSFPRLL
jgi:hypothetical protein